MHGNRNEKKTRKIWASNLNCSRSRAQQWHQHYSSNKNNNNNSNGNNNTNNNNNSIAIKKGMQKNTTDDEMGWAAHKKWLLIFLSKFCLRLCGDFCLLFSACSYPWYIHSLCMCNSPGSHRVYSSLLLLLLLILFFRFHSYFVVVVIVFFFSILFFVRFVFVVSSSCCHHRWWFSIQFIFGSLLLLLPFLFYGRIFFSFSAFHCMRFSTLLLFLRLFFVMIFPFLSRSFVHYLSLYLPLSRSL